MKAPGWVRGLSLPLGVLFITEAVTLPFEPLPVYLLQLGLLVAGMAMLGGFSGYVMGFIDGTRENR
jgi:hypothetical protein